MNRNRILCVDDETMIVDALKMELMSSMPSEILIDTAMNADEAFSVVNEALESGDEIVLVISDLRMPGMTGETLLAKLNEIIPNALKILLTGYADLEAVQYAINHAGLFRYIQKPWDRDDLVLTVKQAVDKYNTKKALDEKTLQIIRMNEELEAKVEERTAQLSLANKELESFSYTVSHDLKSPLRSIDYYARFILEDYTPILNPEVIQMVGQIRDTCSEMFELINKLLLYSITAKAMPELLSVDMDLLFRGAFNELVALEEERDISLFIESTLPIVHGDPILLKQAVNNILSNSIKFTRIREKAAIEINYQKQDSLFVFEVKDNGVGFNMRYSEKLFGIFQRLHHKDDYEGTGIGLATVKKIINKHGGSVDIFSEEDKGTKVTFTLPCSQSKG